MIYFDRIEVVNFLNADAGWQISFPSFGHRNASEGFECTTR